MFKVVNAASAAVILFAASSAYADIYVQPGETYINNVDYINTGFIDNAGQIVNLSRIDNQSEFYNSSEFINEVGAVLDNYGRYIQVDFINPSVSTINNGVINNYFGDAAYGLQGIGIEQGQFTNNNVLNNYGSASVHGAGQLTNFGTISNNGFFTAYDSGVVNNQATFANNAEFIINTSSVLNNSGDYINNNNLTINNENTSGTTARVNNFGYLENNGVISSENFTISVYDEPSSTIQNNHIIQNNGVIEDVAEIINSGIINNGINGQPAPVDIIMRNAGEILNLSTFNNNEGGSLSLYEDSHFINDVGGVLNNGQTESFSSSAIEMWNSQLTNIGTVNNNAYIYAGSRYIEYGHDRTSIHNAATGTFNNGSLDTQYLFPIAISAGNLAFNNSNLLNEGTFNNNGGGSTVTFSGYTRLINSGEFNNIADARVEFGVTYEGEGEPVIENSGIINNDGTIVSGHYVRLNNTGEINNSINGDIDVSEIIGTGSIVNNGIINASVMQIDGSLSGNGRIDTGTISGYVPNQGLVITENGTLAPGNSVGSMQINGDVVLDGTFELEFGYNQYDYWGQDFDVLNISGNLELGPNAVLDISFLEDIGIYYWETSYDFLFADNITGDFSDIIYDGFYDQYGFYYAFNIDLIESDYAGDFLRLTMTEVSPVPVPAAVWLFSSGLLGLFSVARYKRV